MMPGFGLGTFEVRKTINYVCLSLSRAQCSTYVPLYALVIWWSRQSYWVFNWHWLSSFWHRTFVWKRRRSWFGHSKENKSGCCETWRYFHCNKIMEYRPRTGKSWSCMPSKLRKTWLGLHWFVSNALSNRIYRAHTIRLLATKPRWNVWSSVIELKLSFIRKKSRLKSRD